MKDEKKQQCVICHKDITNELPKIDIYGNHYCKDCYIEKCKYELMNMRDTILINKELLKRELQFLEEQTQKQTRKETAKEILEIMSNIICEMYGGDAPCNYNDYDEDMLNNCGGYCDKNCTNEHFVNCWKMFLKAKIKKYGVEVENDG